MHQNQKTVMTLAIAAALALPLVAAAQSNVTVYGKLYPQYERSSQSGATATGAAVSTLSNPAVSTPDQHTLSMESPNSRLGFRGTEKISGNLKAIFQLEMAIGVDTGSLSNPAVLFGRNTFVGLAGDFGTVKLGNMDTVYKELGDTIGFFGVSSGNFVAISNVLSKPGLGTSSSSSFHLRRTNSMIYETPEFAGFQALFDYSLGEVPGGGVSKGSVISTGLKYEAGPVYAALAYEVHNDLFGGSKNVKTALRNSTNPLASSDDRALRLTGVYKFGKQTKAEINVARLEYEETGGAAGKFDSYRKNTWSVAAEHKIGAFTLAAAYGQGSEGSCSLVGGAACSTDGLDGKMLSVGAAYSLSKRTMLYALGSRINNGDSALYENLAKTDVAMGQNISTVALGISHNF